MPSDSTDTGQLVERLRAGDRQALTDLFQRHRDRLHRMVELRMDARIQGRLDASDVLQDAFLDAAARLDGYLRRPELPPFLWLRLVVAERLAIAHRRHLGTKMRDVGQEVSLYRDPLAPGQLGRPGLDAAGPPHLALRGGGAGRAWYSGSRRPSTRWTPLTAKSWRCDTSSSSAGPRRRRSWGSPRKPWRSGTSGPSRRLKPILATRPGDLQGF